MKRFLQVTLLILILLISLSSFINIYLCYLIHIYDTVKTLGNIIRIVSEIEKYRMDNVKGVCIALECRYID